VPYVVNVKSDSGSAMRTRLPIPLTCMAVDPESTLK
jgi:hypothetical protein